MFSVGKSVKAKVINMSSQDHDDKTSQLGSLKRQWLWMIGLWSGSVIALFIVVKILKVLMTAAGLR